MTDRRREGDDLTGRRSGYRELKGELQSFFRKIWVIILLIGVLCALALGAFGIVLEQQQKAALERCENQNIRHDNAIYALNFASNQDQLNAKTEAAREEIRRRRDVTIGLIDAIAPKTDCSNPTKVKPLPVVTQIPEEIP